MDHVGCLVVGGGVVGLAIARRLALAGHEVMLAESADRIGTGVSSRNSEVIHAGIYYRPDSLKARLCVEGNHALYQYCELNDVPHRGCGKLIVATDDAEVAQLSGIVRTAASNGVELKWIDGDELRKLEPEVRAAAGLLSPTTGIIDTHRLMRSLQHDAEGAGAGVLLRCPVLGGQSTGEGFVVRLGGREQAEIHSRWVVNAAGLGAVGLARELGCVGIPPMHLAKGNYFALTGNPGFSHLVYPVPQQEGLGVHLTLDLAGNVRFGPDVEWIDHEDYSVDETRSAGFYSAIRRYWPGLPDGALHPDYAGIRPKLQAPGEPARDFAIEGPTTHGWPGLVNLFGIESPGLTACLAIADHVAALLQD